MEKSWIGVGILGGIVLIGSVVHMNQISTLNQRIQILEKQQSHSSPSAVPQALGSDSIIQPSPHQLEEGFAQDFGGLEATGGEATEKESPMRSKIEEVVRSVGERAKSEMRNRRQERMAAMQQEIVEDASDELGWTQEQEEAVAQLLEDRMAERMELRELVREGELDWSEARDRAEQGRDALRVAMEGAVGSEGLEAVLSRIPGGGRR